MTLITSTFQGNPLQEGDNTHTNPQHDIIVLNMSDGRLVTATKANAKYVIERGEATLVTERPVAIIGHDGNPIVIEDSQSGRGNVPVQQHHKTAPRLGTMKIEQRSFAGALRAAADEGKFELRGYAASFNTLSQEWMHRGTDSAR